MIILKLTFLTQQGGKMDSTHQKWIYVIFEHFLYKFNHGSAQYYRILSHIAPFSWISAKHDG